MLKVYINFVGKHICVVSLNTTCISKMILEGIYLSRPLCKNFFIKFVYQYYNHIRVLNLQRPYT